MNKKILIVIAILFSAPVLAQENISLKGKIKADSLQAAAVHIINLTQKTGTVNNESGEFKLKVSENDVILFSSVQYKNISLEVTSDILKKGFVEIVLSEELNELAEVNISNINLSGNLSADIANIQIVKDLPVNLNFNEIKHKIYEDDVNDLKKAPENLAFQQNQLLGGAGESVNILGVASLVSGFLGLKKEKNNGNFTGPVVSNTTKLRMLFDDDFFKSQLGIKEEHLEEFIFYLNDNGLSAELLKQQNGLVLVEFLKDRSKQFIIQRHQN